MPNEFRETVDRVLDIFRVDGNSDNKLLEAVNKQLADQIKQVNVRLRECDDLLQKGLRADAIQRCELPPDLLESVAILDFAEADAWSSYMRKCGIQPPPELAIDVAADLNDAYLKEQPLKKLLRLHRLHALARNPLRTRIHVLRAIARIDSSNPLWANDLRQLEKARHQQIEQELETAIARKDCTALASFEEELRDPDWLDRPSRQLLKQAVRMHTKFRRERARQEMVRLEPELTQAYANFDLTRARGLRMQWEAKAAICTLEPNDELFELVAPAMQWIEEENSREAEENEYQRALALLETALDQNEDRIELERLYHAVVRFDRGVPDVMETRLSERLKYLDIADFRKNLVRGVISVLLVIVVTGLTGFFILRHVAHTRVMAHVQNVDSRLRSGDIPKAEEYVKRTEEDDPRIAEYPEWRGVKAKVEVARSKFEAEVEREHLFLVDIDSRMKELQEDFENLDKGALPEPMERKQVTSIDNALREINDVLATCEELSQPTRGEIELNVNNLKRQFASVQADRLREIDDRFDKKLKELADALRAVDGTDLEAIDTLRKDVTALRDTPLVPNDSKAAIGPLLVNLDRLREREIGSRKEAAKLQEITSTVGTIDKYLASLQDYAVTFPGQPRTERFQQLVENEKDHWRSLETAMKLADDWAQRDLRRVNPEQAAELITTAEEHCEKHPDLPPSDSLKQLVPYLEAVTNRIDEDGDSIVDQLKTTLNSPVLTDLFMVQVRTANGKPRQYFCPKPPTKIGNTFVFHHYVDLDFGKTERLKVAIENAVVPRAGADGEPDWTAPQTNFSKDALGTLANLAAANWEPIFYEILADLYGAKLIPPVLKLQLLQAVLEKGCQGSHCFKQAFTAQLNVIQNAGIPQDTNWIHREDADRDEAIRAAEELLKNLHELMAEAKESLATEYTKLDEPDLGPRYRWVGWLSQNEDQTWKCNFGSNSEQGAEGDVFVLNVELGASGAQPFPIGTVRGGDVKLASGDSSGLVEGRPLYVQVDRKAK